MKKFFGTLAMVIVITIHFAARFIMEDAYTFSPAEYKDLHTYQSLTAGFASELKEPQKAASSMLGQSSFHILPHDAFSTQWNP